MSLASKALVLILAPIVLIIGFLVTFSLMSGKISTSELFTRIEISANLYFLFGVLLIIGILIFAIFSVFKEKFLRSYVVIT